MGLDHLVQPLIEFVRSHEAWAAPIMFCLAFAESLAFISLLVPAWGVLVGIGALIGPSGIAFVPIWLAGALGAACGDWLSYWLGATFQTAISPVWALARPPQLPPPGRAFVEGWGGPPP